MLASSCWIQGSTTTSYSEAFYPAAREIGTENSPFRKQDRCNKDEGGERGGGPLVNRQHQTQLRDIIDSYNLIRGIKYNTFKNFDCNIKLKGRKIELVQTILRYIILYMYVFHVMFPSFHVLVLQLDYYYFDEFISFLFDIDIDIDSMCLQYFLSLCLHHQ